MPTPLEDGRLGKFVNPSGSHFDIQELGKGFNATGYKVTVGDTSFFARSLNSSQLANATTADKIRSTIEGSFSLPHTLHMKVLGFAGSGEVVQLSDVSDVITVGELIPKGYMPFLELLRQPTSSPEELAELVDSAEKYAIQMADVIADIHAYQIPFEQSSTLRRDLYTRATRAIIHNDELLAGVEDLIDLETNTWITEDEIDSLNAHMRKTRAVMGNNPQRLTSVHGDYWAANLFIHPSNEPLTSDTRINYGEPGTDLGWMIGEFLLQDLVRFGEFGHTFTQIAQNALDHYQQKRPDSDIAHYMSLGYGFQAFAEATFTPNLSDIQRRELLYTAFGVLQNAQEGKALQLDNMNIYKANGKSLVESK